MLRKFPCSEGLGFRQRKYTAGEHNRLLGPRVGYLMTRICTSTTANLVILSLILRDLPLTSGYSMMRTASDATSPLTMLEGLKPPKRQRERKERSRSLTRAWIAWEGSRSTAM